ncbi:hypothetical protein [Winogradskya humida]|uniref:Integral membrane protein n=1 Tax=Winogradskya humida TaxID=113566 RepID=A0ABQ3ZUA8_9ACTN|nr:hypothetical protein [Actinoplanes humidus]GIE22171.1 hypothetical protein Ahu01nite_052730 [Actinoplanes humidus]
MENMTHAATATAATAAPTAAQDALGVVATCFKAYTALSGIALAATIAMAGTGHTVNTFMWVRSILLPIIAVVLYQVTLAASRGSARAFDRIRAVTMILPIAIIAVDLIPGVCPSWYAAMQAVCMIPVIVAAVVTRQAALRAAFPKA